MARHIIDIITDIVGSKMRPNGTITAISEIALGQYQITSDRVINNLLLEGQRLTISNTVGFNGNYLVQSVDYENAIFTINTTASIAIPPILGTWESGPTYFYTENISSYAEYLSNNTMLSRLEQNRFPSLLLVSPITKNIQVRNKIVSYPNLLIYLIMSTKIERKLPWRHVNTFPYLRLMENAFIEGLEESKELANVINIESSELPMPNTPQENNLNSIIDAIELNISDIRIINQNCT